jgi:hypothetical protein
MRLLSSTLWICWRRMRHFWSRCRPMGDGADLAPVSIDQVRVSETRTPLPKEQWRTPVRMIWVSWIEKLPLIFIHEESWIFLWITELPIHQLKNQTSLPVFRRSFLATLASFFPSNDVW